MNIYLYRSKKKLAIFPQFKKKNIRILHFKNYDTVIELVWKTWLCYYLITKTILIQYYYVKNEKLIPLKWNKKSNLKNIIFQL